MKSIGVMTRGKAEAKYFPSRWENLRLSEIEKEKCGEKGEDREKAVAGEEENGGRAGRPAGGIRAAEG